MAEVGIPYELIGPDGTRVVFGNADTAAADPDYIGPLDAENGVSGLLDVAATRESSSDLVERDGGAHGPFYSGRRSGTLQGLLLPWSDAATRQNAEAKLKRASRALRTDAVLRWTPSNASSARMLRVRRQDGPRVTGRRPKAWQVALVSADPFALDATESSLVITPGAAAGELGMANPLTDPLTSDVNVTAAQSVVNAGDAPTWPRFRIDGPITNPELLNYTIGLRIRLIYTLAGGEWLDVYPERARILLAGTADRYNALDFAASSWWTLSPGANDVRLLAAAYSAGAQVTVYWRNAYE